MRSIVMILVGAAVLTTTATGQTPIFQTGLDDLASITASGGDVQGGPASFVPGAIGNAFAGTGSAYARWTDSDCAAIFGSWSNGNGITVDLYFRGDHWSTHAGDSGFWAIARRSSDRYFIVSVRDGKMRHLFRDGDGEFKYTFDGGATAGEIAPNVPLTDNVTYRLTVRQANGVFDMYLDDIGGNTYSNAAPLFSSTNLPAGYVWDMVPSGGNPAREMDVARRSVFDGANTALQAGEWVDNVRVFNGAYSPAELDTGGQPTAVITADVTGGPAPLAVDFDGSGSFDQNGGTIVGYAWDFEGDGGTPDSVLADPPPFVYSNPGAYNATLTVTDNESNTASTSVLISVQHRLAITAFDPTGGPLSGSQPALSITCGGDTFSDLIGPDVVEIIGSMNGEQNTGLCDLDAATSMIGIELGRGASAVAAGEAIRGYFPAGVVINADGTPKPELFLIEYANTVDSMVAELLTNGPGAAPVIVATVSYQATDFIATSTRMAAFSGANSPLGGVGIDLDAAGVTGITGVQLTDPNGGIDPVAIIAVDPPGTLIAPVVTISASPTTGGFPLPVSFSTCPAYDVDGPIVSYEWDFTNDGVVDATGPAAEHTYPVAGVFTAKVTVTDEDGLSDSDTIAITVTGPNPKRSIIAMLPSGNLTGSQTLTSVTTEFPGGTPTFTQTSLVGPPGPIDGTLHVEFEGAMNGSGTTQLGPTTDPKAAMVGLELGAGVAGLGGDGDFLRGYFPNDVLVNPDGTDAPEIFFVERSSSTDNFQLQLLTSGPGVFPAVVTSVQVLSGDYSSTATVVGSNALGGIGIDLDALGVSGVRGVQIPGTDGLGGDTGVDPVIIAGIPTSCNLPFADADGDGDVDMVDFAAYQVCFTDSGNGQFFDSERCFCFDRDGDSDVDETDLNQFLDCATGPEVPWDQELAPDCQP